MLAIFMLVAQTIIMELKTIATQADTRVIMEYGRNQVIVFFNNWAGILLVILM